MGKAKSKPTGVVRNSGGKAKAKNSTTNLTLAEGKMKNEGISLLTGGGGQSPPAQSIGSGIIRTTSVTPTNLTANGTSPTNPASSTKLTPHIASAVSSTSPNPNSPIASEPNNTTPKSTSTTTTTTTTSRSTTTTTTSRSTTTKGLVTTTKSSTKAPSINNFPETATHPYQILPEAESKQNAENNSLKLVGIGLGVGVLIAVIISLVLIVIYAKKKVEQKKLRKEETKINEAARRRLDSALNINAEQTLKYKSEKDEKTRKSSRSSNKKTKPDGKKKKK
uniref:Uncharacterized protein n=1 Tax=Strongyloides papillosus TaxID=174720 RepID=A0A0N5BEE3_STREA